MSAREAAQPCALFGTRDAAEAAQKRLREHGIEAEIGRPGARTHGIGDDAWQVNVPGTRAARARAILSTGSDA